MRVVLGLITAGAENYATALKGMKGKMLREKQEGRSSFSLAV